MNSEKHSDSNPEETLRELIHAAMSVYAETKSLRKTADELDLNPLKVRKLLVTARYGGIDGLDGMEMTYESDTADEVNRLRKEGKDVAEIMSALRLSRASVNSYLPYTKAPYKTGEQSANAERVSRHRERNAACARLRKDGGMEHLWAAIVAFQGYPFYTAKGLRFQYEVRGGEIKVNRKEKTVTRSSVEMAYQKALAGGVSGPKKLGVFGSSYLYPMFVRFGIV
ncbi:MAG: hypothetical protein LIO45_01840 [Clostridiales bacterium]|nr:hypothetical protein [Clostridiales bacterium]